MRASRSDPLGMRRKPSLLPMESPRGLHFIIEDEDAFSFVHKPRRAPSRRGLNTAPASISALSMGSDALSADRTSSKISLAPLRRKTKFVKRQRYAHLINEQKRSLDELVSSLAEVRRGGLSNSVAHTHELCKVESAVRSGGYFNSRLGARLRTLTFSEAEEAAEKERLMIENAQRKHAATRLQCMTRKNQARKTVHHRRRKRAATTIQARQRQKAAFANADLRRKELEEQGASDKGAGYLLDWDPLVVHKDTPEEAAKKAAAAQAADEARAEALAANLDGARNPILTNKAYEGELLFSGVLCLDVLEDRNAQVLIRAAGARPDGAPSPYALVVKALEQLRRGARRKIHSCGVTALQLATLGCVDFGAEARDRCAALCEQVANRLVLEDGRLVCDVEAAEAPVGGARPDPPGTRRVEGGIPPGEHGLELLERVPPPRGVTVAGVLPGSPLAGQVEPGQLVTAIDGVDMTGADLATVDMLLAQRVDKMSFGPVPDGTRRAVAVQVHDARQLLAAWKEAGKKGQGKGKGKGKGWDRNALSPYVRLVWTLGDGEVVLGETRPQPPPAADSPMWKRATSTFRLYDFPADDEVAMSFCALALEVRSGEDAVLGRVVLAGQQLLPASLPAEKTYFALGGDGGVGQLGISFAHGAQLDAAGVGMGVGGAGGGVGGAGGGDLHWPLLSVQVCGARDLAKADGGVFGGKSDPYCIVFCDGEKVGETAVVKKTLNPVWDRAVVDVELDDRFTAASEVRVEVHDHDKVGAHNFLGQVKLTGIQICRLAAGEVTAYSAALEEKDIAAGAADSGSGGTKSKKKELKAHKKRNKFVQGELQLRLALVDKALLPWGDSETTRVYQGVRRIPLQQQRAGASRRMLVAAYERKDLEGTTYAVKALNVLPPFTASTFEIPATEWRLQQGTLSNAPSDSRSCCQQIVQKLLLTPGNTLALA